MQHASLRLRGMVLRHVSHTLLIKITGPESSVDPPPTHKDKGRDLKRLMKSVNVMRKTLVAYAESV